MVVDKTFSSPVFVKVHDMVVREIASILDAIDFLEEWPQELHDARHDAVLRYCFAAHDGRHAASSARDAFAKWAKVTNILEEGEAVPPWMLAGLKSGFGGQSA